MTHVVSSDGTTIAFDRSGSGPAIILVGGAIQYRSIDPRTAELAALLAEHFTVFNYDRRGRGASGDTAPYAVEREVEDLQALIAEAGGSAHVFAMSSGGAIALEAAHRIPITKLVLYEPPFVVDDSRPPVPADYLARLTELIAAGRRGDAVELFMTEPVGLPAEFVGPMRAMPMWAGFEAVAHTLAYDATAMGDTQSGSRASIQRWAAVTVPTLVLDGGDSPEYQGNAVQALADTLPQAQRRTLEGQTHEVAPAVLAPALEAFFGGA
jgi:pimeloyl-ACP methyl ester carboxylesterase